MKKQSNSLLICTLFGVIASFSMLSPSYAENDDGKKVNICHLPPGNPENGQNLRISENGWKTGTGPGKHKAGGHGGDYLGSCSGGSDSNNSDSSHSDSVNPDSSRSDSSKPDSNSSDSNNRGEANEAKNIVICHIPNDKSEDRQTIHIAFSAWAGHRDNHGGDYLGSCNSRTEIKEDTIVIKNCKGEYRKTLIELTQSYFDPIIVNDDAYDDEATVRAISQCLDHGDSSDSGKNKSDSGQGKGHDSVSDSGKHHRIRGCKNLDSSDSNHDSNDSSDSNTDSTESDSSKNYAKKLRDRSDSHDNKKGHGDSSINISDSSLDDSDVYDEYKKCVDSDSGHKGDSGKGDSGHKYRVMNNCSNAAEIKEKVKLHHAKIKDEKKYEQRLIVIKSSSLTDKHIAQAVKDCTDSGKGGGEELTLPYDDDNGHGYRGRLNWKEVTKK